MKIRQTKPVDIDGQNFVITQFPATFGNKILKEIQKLFLPLWAELNIKEGAMDAEFIKHASDKLSELDEELIRDMVCQACSIQPKKFDDEFAGAYSTLFELVYEIVWFNYEDVFQKLGLQRDLLGTTN